MKLEGWMVLVVLVGLEQKNIGVFLEIFVNISMPIGSMGLVYLPTFG